MRLHSPTKTSAGTTHDASVPSQLLSPVPVKRTFAASSSRTSSGSSTRVVTKRCVPCPARRSSSSLSFGRKASSPLAASVPRIACFESVRSLTLPAFTSLMKSL
jgi:hypothetical protein